MPDTSRSTIKPTHKAIQSYYAALQSFSSLNVSHETGLRTAFQNMLTETARMQHWTLITEQTLKLGGKHIRPDGVMRDEFNLPRGYWEAKDTDDDLDSEIRKKSAKGYPLTNIIFEDTREAALYQDGQERFRANLTTPQQVADLLNQFYGYAEPDIESFEQAVTEFQERVPELATGLAAKIQAAHQDNKKFQTAYAAFFELCKSALNPNISQAAVDEMLVQHLLTERLIRKIFDNTDFMNNNAIAVEIEKVIRALVSPSFSREEYLKSLDRFYRAIEDAAHGLEDFAEKQHFLNSIYERFFQGYSVKIADTHGIVYTPQPIVDFMCASVVEVLQTEFGKTLGDPDVVILDPATGTGNFIVNLLRRIPRRDLEHAYKERLFANEIMLLPYYIAALNIEHAYYELTGQYESFEGLCFVDTLDIAEGAQMRMGFMTEANSVRVERQKKAPITVIIGNPPYNVGQVNENDNNKNRKYEVIDKRINETYAADSTATNTRALSDAYVKFFRWAVDRLQGRDGIVCYVSNNSFVDQVAFDGMRRHLLQDFTHIYHVDLHGNVRQNPKLSGTAHNVFGIQVGVGITVAIRSTQHTERNLYYHRLPEFWRKGEKLDWLAQSGQISGINWQSLVPDERHTWRVPENANEFSSYIPIGSISTKESKGIDVQAVFKTYGRGLETTRDAWAYDFDRAQLILKVKRLIETYNGEIDRWKRAKKPKDIDGFVSNDETKIKWSSRLKETFVREIYAQFDEQKIRRALYRPFTRQFAFFDSILNHRQGIFSEIFPTIETEQDNYVIWVKVGSEWPAFALVSNHIVDLLPQGGSQCFPFYVYSDLPSPAGEGPGVRASSSRRENITDWALTQFRDHYGDESISKWDIFYYVYGVLHHPGYREKFADNLKRELPRIPFAPALTPNPSPAGEGSGEAKQLVSKLMIQVGRDLRQRQTDVELMLWEYVRDRRLGGLKFRRQHPIPESTYVADFYCYESRLVIELDGPIHDQQQMADAARQREIEALGYHVIRFSNTQVFNDLEMVLNVILNAHRFFLPSPAGEGSGVRASSGFRAFAEAGRKLADLHLNYEQIEPYSLQWIEAKDTPLSYRVEKMRLSKDKAQLVLNDSLTLAGIPPEAFQYRLGNRSALDWVIDQYQVTTDKRSGITSDPNREDDPRYIVDLVGRVIAVSLETVKIVSSLPEEYAALT